MSPLASWFLVEKSTGHGRQTMADHVARVSGLGKDCNLGSVAPNQLGNLSAGDKEAAHFGAQGQHQTTLGL
jgi:hypothetical protein